VRLRVRASAAEYALAPKIFDSYRKVLYGYEPVNAEDSVPRPNRRVVALVTLTGGGHQFQTRRLMASIGDAADFVYLRKECVGMPGEYNVPYGESYLAPSLVTMAHGRNVNAFLRVFKMTFDVVRRHSVDAIIVVASSDAVPMFLAGRILGCKTIFIESVARVDRMSLTGKIVYYLRLARIFIVQWPELQKGYPLSQLGTVL
jgi:UDP-N-acetylglucosamine:LPS N-acetylglucosamine transferase